MDREAQLRDIASRMGYREVPEALSAADLPIERGHHLALAVAHGGGEEAVYARALEEVCDPRAPGDAVQALILVPTRDRALDVALKVQRAVSPFGIRVAVPPLRADGSVDAEEPRARCVVERPSHLLPEVRLGRLGIGGLRLLVIDGLADLEQVDELESAEPILDTLPAETRRVVTSRRVDDRLHELVQMHLQRARRWPEDAFREAREAEVKSGAGGAAHERARADAGHAPSEEARLSVLMTMVRDLPEHTTIRVRCRSEDSIPRVAAALESLGLGVAPGADGWDLVASSAPDGEAEDPEEERPGEGESTALVWFGLPLSADRLVEGPGGARRLLIVDVTHGPQLELMARRAGMDLHLVPGLVPATELDPLERYRGVVRARIERGGTDAELLVLEPLVREFGTTRVVAAVSDLLRRSAAGAPIRPWPDVEAATQGTHDRTGARRERGAASEPRGVRPAWSRIYVGAGKRDDVRAGDLVGAITGETGIAGAQIGKVDIRGNFSLIEIDSQVVDDVIRKLDGTTIRGRAVTVRPDRGG